MPSDDDNRRALIDRLEKLCRDDSSNRSDLAAARRYANLAAERAIVIERLAELDEELDLLLRKSPRS